MTPLDILLTGYDITDEVINRTSSASLKLEHDTIRGSADVEIWTGPGGTGTQLAMTTDYTLGSEDTRLTTAAGVTIYKTLAVINGAYHATDLYVTYNTVGDYASVASIRSAAIQTAIQTAIQYGHFVGENVMSEFEETPSEDFPALPRNVNQDIALANWPLLVPKARSKSISILGVTDHAVTVAGAVITFPIAASTTALLRLFVADGVVTNYINGGEIANFTGGAVYNVVAAQRTVTIAAVDYTITAIDTVARTITVSVNPPAGAQNLSVFPYRIAGSATTARFLRIAGFVGVAAGDAGGEVVGGFRKMDRGHGHWHGPLIYNSTVVAGVYSATVAVQPANTTNPTATTGGVGGGTMVTDSINGTPRTGKTTDPRTAGQYAYTWGGQYIAP
jgi:hypothetical protein